MIHLNFWSGYKAKELCCLCQAQEQNCAHIVYKCAIILEIISDFKLSHTFNDEYKIAFGINEGMLNNFILFHIKTTVFRNRFKKFSSRNVCKAYLIKSTKKGIRNALKMRHIMAIRQNTIENFTKIFGKTVVLDNQETFRIVHFQDNKMILNI